MSSEEKSSLTTVEKGILSALLEGQRTTEAILTGLNKRQETMEARQQTMESLLAHVSERQDSMEALLTHVSERQDSMEVLLTHVSERQQATEDLVRSVCSTLNTICTDVATIKEQTTEMAARERHLLHKVADLEADVAVLKHRRAE